MLIGKLYYFIDTKDKIYLSILFLLAILIGFIELIGVASIVPFIGLLNDPDYFADNKYFLMINQYLLFDNESLVFISGIFLIMSFVLINSLNAYNLWLTTRYGATLSHKISMLTKKSYLGQSYKYFINADIASISKNILEESGSLGESIIIPFMQIISKIIIVTFISILLIIVNFEAFIYSSLIILSIYIFLFKNIKNKIKDFGSMRLQANDERFKNVNDCFNSIKDVKYYGAENYYLNNFSKSQNDFLNLTVKCIILSTMPKYIIEIIGFGGFFSVILYMKYLGIDISLYLPVIGLFVFATYRLLPSINQIYALSSTLRFHIPALDIIYNVVTLNKSKHFNYNFKKMNSLITFNNVSFSHNDNDLILKNINLEITKGTINAIIGETGAGKTTLLDLLLGFYQPRAGIINMSDQLIDIDSRKIKIGYVPQKISFIDDSVYQNIAFGSNDRDTDINKINNIIETVKLKELVSNLPNKAYEKIGENGVKLSGGQLQRIGMARALYLDPKILILDEATNALDINTELDIFNSIIKSYKDLTIIWITHRPSSLSLCNNIFYLNKGSIKYLNNKDNSIKDDDYIKNILQKEI